MKRLVVSAAARGDLGAIARYTERHWGAAQKRSYLARMRGRFRELRRNPAIGAPRGDIKPGYRSLPAGRHLIFYRETTERIEVLRVLHQSMDVARHLASDTDDEPA